jgi:hypothetical protein
MWVLLVGAPRGGMCAAKLSRSSPATFRTQRARLASKILARQYTVCRAGPGSPGNNPRRVQPGVRFPSRQLCRQGLLMRTTLHCVGKCAAHAIEDVPKGVGETLHGYDRAQTHQRGHQGIFDEILTGIVSNQRLQHLHHFFPFSSHACGTLELRSFATAPRINRELDNSNT